MPFKKLDDGGMEYQPMSGAEFRRIRHEFGMKKLQFGYLLGYTGEPQNITLTMTRFEKNRREVPPAAERLLMLLRWYKSDFGYLPDLDNGRRDPMEMPEFDGVAS